MTRIRSEHQLVFFSFLSFIGVGFSLVLTGWVAVTYGTVSTVGQVFLVGSLTAITASFFSGAYADGRPRKRVSSQALLIRLVGSLVLVVGFAVDGWSLYALYIFTVLYAAGSSLLASSSDGLIQDIVDADRRMQFAMRASTARQIGIVVGTFLGGVTIHHTSLAVASLLVAFLTASNTLFFRYIFRNVKEELTRLSPIAMISSWRVGLIAISKRTILITVLVSYALVFSASQISNVLVPGFVRDTLHQGSDVYGMLETVWAIGGGAALATFSAGSIRLSQRYILPIIICIIGILMISFSTSTNIPLVTLLYALLGALVAVGRAVCDGIIISEAPRELVGRVRAASSIVVSSCGCLIYISPTLFGSENILYFYILWGVLLLISGFVVLSFIAFTNRKQI